MPRIDKPHDLPRSRSNALIEFAYKIIVRQTGKQLFVYDDAAVFGKRRIEFFEQLVLCRFGNKVEISQIETGQLSSVFDDFMVHVRLPVRFLQHDTASRNSAFFAQRFQNRTFGIRARNAVEIDVSDSERPKRFGNVTRASEIILARFYRYRFEPRFYGYFGYRRIGKIIMIDTDIADNGNGCGFQSRFIELIQKRKGHIFTFFETGFIK